MEHAELTETGPDRPRRWSFTRIALTVLVAPLALLLAIVLFFVVAGHIWEILMLAGGVFIFHMGFVEYRNMLSVRNLPTAKASSAAVGLVELAGRARGGTPTPAPVSGTLSASWTVAIERDYSGKNGGWRGVAERRSPFTTLEVEDETGRMLIWPRSAELVLDSSTWVSVDGPPPDGGARLLAEAGIEWPAGRHSQAMRLVETRIEEGGPLYVLGTVCERAQIPARFLRPAQADAAPASVPAATPAAQDSRAARWAQRAGLPLDPNRYPPDVDPTRLLMWKGDQKRPFVIASSEQKALKSLSSKMKWELAIGPLLIVIALLMYLFGR
jgi:hypothetical protein